MMVNFCTESSIGGSCLGREQRIGECIDRMNCFHGSKKVFRRTQTQRKSRTTAALPFKLPLDFYGPRSFCHLFYFESYASIKGLGN